MPSSANPLFDVRSAQVADDVSIAYMTAGKPDRNRGTILLLHGYPQTMFSMRHLLRLFAERGYFAVAADYRGAGGSSMPSSGYDKWTMANDLHTLMTKWLGLRTYVVLGHDIGSMVATAQALRFRNEGVEALIMMECPQPGTSAYAKFTTDPNITMGSMFHFFFHNAADLPEQLTVGREEIYLRHFFDRLSYRPYFLTADERKVYYDAFARAGRMRAGFEVYRAFRQDDADVRRDLQTNGKLSIPVLTVSGAHSVFVEHIHAMGQDLGASVVEFASIKDASHWIPEENPEDLVKESVEFLKEHGL